MKPLTMCILLIFTILSYAGEVSDEADREVERRLNNASLYHLAIGAGFEVSPHMSTSAGVTFRYGATRQLMNYFSGINFGRRILSESSPQIVFSQFSMEGGVIENLFRTPMLSVYLSESILFNAPFSSKYIMNDIIISDKRTLKCNFTSKLGAGLAFNNLNFSIYVKYDMNPTYNQKYIYENPEFDYYGLRNQIDNRLSYGISILYYINF